MDAHSVAWGLDIGHTAIKAVKLARQGDSVSVLGYVIEPVPHEGERSETLITALKHLAAREEFGSTPVFAALSGKEVLSRTVNVPVLGNNKDIGRIIELEAAQQIPGGLENVEWGYHLSPGSDGSSYDVALFAVKRDIVADLIAKTKAAGLNLAGLAPSSLAVYNFVSYDQSFPSDETTIVLDVGAGNSDLVFYQGEALSIASLTTSGNDITEAFVKKFRVSFAEAERLKREVGDSRQADRIIKVIEGTLNDLIAQVQRRIGVYKGQRPEAKLENLVISGNTFRMPGLPEYFAERLRYTINILEDLDRIKIAPGLPRDHFMTDLQGLGVALGLALQATGTARAKVNLMPTAMQVERLLFTKRWAGIAIVALLAVGFAATWAIKANHIDNNAVIISSIRVANEASINDSDIKKAKEALESVSNKAAELRRFADVGNQQGITTAVVDAIAGLVQRTAVDIFTKEGIQPDLEVNPTRRSEGLSPIYLSGISLEDYAVANDPFRPFATPRKVRVVIQILPGDKAVLRLRQFFSDLRELAVPQTLESTWMKFQPATAAKKPGRLFTEVRQVTEEAEKTGKGMIFYYVDPLFIDPQTGNLTPLKEKREILRIEAVFDCTLPVEVKS